MTSHYAYTDQATGKTRVFYGYLYECRGDAPSSCPNVMRLNHGDYCNHPNCREYDCGRTRNGSKLDS